MPNLVLRRKETMTTEAQALLDTVQTTDAVATVRSDAEKAMNNMGIVTRGLFGEASRAVGAFFQVSITSEELPTFIGACDYLIKEERMARLQLSQGELWAKSLQAVKFAIASREIDLADSLRVLAWVRWAAASGIQDFPISHRQVDFWISTLEVRSTQDPQKANQQRANTLRQYFDPVIFKN